MALVITTKSSYTPLCEVDKPSTRDGEFTMAFKFYLHSNWLRNNSILFHIAQGINRNVYSIQPPVILFNSATPMIILMMG